LTGKQIQRYSCKTAAQALFHVSHRRPDYFLRRGHSGQNLSDSILAQCAHSHLARPLARMTERTITQPARIRRRLANAQDEIKERIYYDYYVVNREVNEAVRVLSSIVEAERSKVSRVTDWRIDSLHQRAR